LDGSIALKDPEINGHQGASVRRGLKVVAPGPYEPQNTPMDFRKTPHPVNFRFAQALSGAGSSRRYREAGLTLTVRDLGDEVFHLTMRGRAWKDESLLPLAWKGAGPSRLRWDWSSKGGFTLGDARGPRLTGKAGASIGVCGRAWLLRFVQSADMRFYGFGEKSLPFERSGLETTYWNTDIWSDHTPQQCESGDTDPMYVSIPFMLIKRPGACLGVLAANPYPTFMGTGRRIIIAPEQTREDESLHVGATDGLPSVYFIAGARPADVVEKLQRLSGCTPLPPLWALGHHQCRWGYQTYRDLDALDRAFRRHRVPCDGLWLDIDYMERFKVFTMDRKKFSDPKAQLADLRRRGRRVVPIIDPGVKVESGYGVYEDGLRRKAFCRNPEGGVFKSFVWPGKTAFPDFSLPRVRAWWAKRMEAFARLGVSGVWLDMNEPALNIVTQDDMLFRDGTRPHAAFHNQYALGMAMASREGFLRARPRERPFLLTRAGFIGSNRFAGFWTGDNTSNWTHLKKTLGLSLNLAISGAPFNGPDVPGFAQDASPALARAWYKAGFLFPFFRNHSSWSSRRQEPWAFGPGSLAVIRHYIRLRYKLLPYLYNLFMGQEEAGSAILRPMFYEFPDSRHPDFDRVDDQFMVGPAILQAPVVEEGRSDRRVLLPAGHWFDLGSGRWIRGGRALQARCGAGGTPVYLREGSLVPMQHGLPEDNAKNLRDLELHVFLRRGRAETDYGFDDGESFDYQKGGRSRLNISVELKGRSLRCAVRSLAKGYGGCTLRLVLYQACDRVMLEQEGRERLLKLIPHRWKASGKPLKAWITEAFQCGGEIL
jgi:alpha-glucosidase